MALGYFGPQGVRWTSGAPAYNRPVRVETAGGALIELFNDRDGLDPAPNPKTTDQYGNLFFYCEPGEYFLEFGVARIPIVVDDPDFDVEDIEDVTEDVLIALEPPVDLVVLFENSIA